jgi:hypothetical protein
MSRLFIPFRQEDPSPKGRILKSFHLYEKPTNRTSDGTVAIRMAVRRKADVMRVGYATKT